MKVSIVIPVYNEADRLRQCLESIAAQKSKANEVIVVDNNSTDASSLVARQFDFVTLLHESKQGVIHARTTGFDAVSGDIIARIDADTVLPADWVSKVKNIFRDRHVSAVSGAPHYYDFAWYGVANKLDHTFRGYLAKQLGDLNFLWGANMAVRRSDWLAVRQNLCSSGSLHEDFDLAIHLQEVGMRVDYEENLLAGVSSRRIDMDFLSFVSYTLKSPQTYAGHGLKRQRHMYPVLLACWVGYLPGRIIYRGYDRATGKFSVARLLSLSEARVDPTANVV